jgi:DNA repair protein RadD
MLTRLKNIEAQKAIDLINKRCSLNDLEKILSDEDVYLGFQNELLKLSPNKKKLRISNIIVNLLGDNLLDSNLLRRSLASQCIENYKKIWKPGSSEAVKFCKYIELPEVFAGTLPPEKPPSVERLDSIDEFNSLTDYQEEVMNKAIDNLVNKRSSLITLPTGAGKTYVATNVVLKWHQINNGTTTMWLTHSEELCEQALECIKQTWELIHGPKPLIIYRGWGIYVNKIINGEIYQNADTAQDSNLGNTIIVTTPLSALKIIKNKKGGSLWKSISNLSLLVIDEAHRAAASTYKEVIKTTTKQINKNTSLIGLSATPVRETYSSKKYEGTQELAKLFNDLIEPVNTLGNYASPIKALQARNILAKLKIIKAKLTDNTDRSIAEYIYKNKKTGEPSLVFTSTVSSSKVIATYLIEKGLSAEYVTGKSTYVERRNIIQGIKNGIIDVLCNCEILTTGFDAPSISEIFLTRQTNSPVLYKQIVGRGLRGSAFGGSEICELHLCGIDLPFEADPNTNEFARTVWANKF